jgi:hypothetical protein
MECRVRGFSVAAPYERGLPDLPWSEYRTAAIIELYRMCRPKEEQRCEDATLRRDNLAGSSSR